MKRPTIAKQYERVETYARETTWSAETIAAANDHDLPLEKVREIVRSVRR